MEGAVLGAAGACRDVIDRLIAKSYDDYIDVNAALNWARGVDRRRPPKRPECGWLYGTRTWEQLDAHEQLELLWAENARDISMFIWLEQTLPPVYVGYVSQFDGRLPPFLREYLMLFSKEEIVHTLMFRRYVELSSLQLFDPPPGIHEFFINVLPKLPPVAGVLFTYLVEVVAEIGAMHGSAGEAVDPLTRELYQTHHREEVRHIAFGRHVVECEIAAMPRDGIARLRTLVEPFTFRLLQQYTYNPEIKRRIPFELNVGDDDASLQAIRFSSNNRRLSAQRFSKLVHWLTVQELIGADFSWAGRGTDGW